PALLEAEAGVVEGRADVAARRELGDDPVVVGLDRLATAAAVQELGPALEEHAGVVALELQLAAAAARDDAHLLHRADVVRRGDVAGAPAAGEGGEGRQEGEERGGARQGAADTEGARAFRAGPAVQRENQAR